MAVMAQQSRSSGSCYSEKPKSPPAASSNAGSAGSKLRPRNAA